jgi:hypothetical protein
MKQLLLLPIAVAALTFAGCDARVETTPPSNTTVVAPGDSPDKKVESNTTVVNPPAGEKTETNTTNVVTPPAPAPAPGGETPKP